MPERTGEVRYEVKPFQRDGQPELVYDEYGYPTADAVVMLHGGAMGNRKQWAHIAPRLAPTHRVLALDMRGHGDSAWADGAYAIESPRTTPTGPSTSRRTGTGDGLTRLRDRWLPTRFSRG